MSSSSIEKTVNLMPSIFRKSVQLPKLATGDIVNGSFVFTAGETIPITNRGTLIINTENPVVADIEIRITYNDAQTLDIIIDNTNDSNIPIRTTVTDIYTITAIDFKPATSDLGTDGDQLTFHCLTGNHAKMIYLYYYSLTQIKNLSYDMFKSIEWTASHDDWVDQLAASWNLVRQSGESDADLIIRITSASTPTIGTIEDISERVVAFLGLTTTPTVTESYDQDGWLLPKSKLLKGGQSELILTGDVAITPMQFIMNISGYTGSLTETEVEDFLRTIINVSSSPIVRFT